MNERFNAYLDSQDALFHYTRTSTALEYILGERQFKPSRLMNGNDPIEYKDRLLSGMAWELAGVEADILWKEARFRISQILREECRRISLCSNAIPEIILDNGNVEEDKYANVKGWAKPRMWAQYGDNHRGICLVFSMKALKEELKKQKDNAAIIEYNAEYMQYTNGSDKTRGIDINRVKLVGHEAYSRSYIIDNIGMLFYRKNIDYRDENEFRAIIIGPSNKLEYLNINSIIKGVIMGDRAAIVYRPLIMELCNNIGIKCARLHYERGTPFILPIKDSEK